MGTVIMLARSIIDEFASNATPAKMDRLITAFRHPNVSDADIAYLAIRLAESGKRLTGFDQTDFVADVPSTGGPSSLSTLICPLHLVSLGALVPKLAVPGRPAGGIDILGCIPGYRVSLELNEIRQCLRACHYAHFLASDEFAPLDTLLFEHRLRVHAVDIPALAIASLVSKKLAVGVRKVVLDVRVAHYTNFGKTWEEARENAKAFIRVARRVSIEAKCYLTDASVPYQPFIGRGECLVAMDEIFRRKHNPELKKHLDLCSQIATACLISDTTPPVEELHKVFADNLLQQGTSMDSFARKVQDIKTRPKVLLTAEADGYPTVNMSGIRRILVERQAAAMSATERFPDPCGMVLLAGSGTYVRKGEALAQIRAASHVEALRRELRPYVDVVPERITPRRDPELVT